MKVAFPPFYKGIRQFIHGLVPLWVYDLAPKTCGHTICWDITKYSCNGCCEYSESYHIFQFQCPNDHRFCFLFSQSQCKALSGKKCSPPLVTIHISTGGMTVSAFCLLPSLSFHYLTAFAGSLATAPNPPGSWEEFGWLNFKISYNPGFWTQAEDKELYCLSSVKAGGLGQPCSTGVDSTA